MLDFFEWFQNQNPVFREKPWLVLGKGPSFSLIKDFDVSHFNTFGLNHVVTKTKLDVAHIIDLDVVESCGEALLSNAKYVVMPWFPHVSNRPDRRSLERHLEQIPVLRQLDLEGKLLWYNKSGSAPNGASPVVQVTYFSAEAPYALLGMAGVKKIRSLGIDGGASYSTSFGGLPTLLANGQPSFDKQFREIANSIMTYELDAAPLNVESPIRVYVATTEEQMLSVKVLEYSVRKHTSMNVEVIPMHISGIEIPSPQAAESQPRTPFSFQRFLIPKLAGYRGRAIYLDSDMQVFADMRELWSYDISEHQVFTVLPAAQSDRNPQYSVMLLNCDHLQWDINDIVKALDQGELTYEDLMYHMRIAPSQMACIPAEWNSLEKYSEGKTKLVHYTDMDTQPWIYAKHPLSHLWVGCLLDAVRNGFISREYVMEHIRNGWARPSLQYQIENNIADSLLLPSNVLAKDKNYSPPYHKLPKHSARPWSNTTSYLKAMIRHRFYNSSVFGYLRRAKRHLPW